MSLPNRRNKFVQLMYAVHITASVLARLEGKCFVKLRCPMFTR